MTARRALAVAGVALALLLGAPPARADQRAPVVLLVLAHPDDETMIGGVLGRLRDRRIRVVTAVVTNGEGGKLVVRVPRRGDLIERAPGEPGTGRVRTAADLAALRQREARAAARRAGVAAVHFLSDVARPTFRDDYDGGTASWDTGALGARLAAIAAAEAPDVVITLNPDEGAHAHPQHTGLGAIVRDLHAAGRLDADGRTPSLYGIREHDWYVASAAPQPGDVAFARTPRYRAALRRVAATYRSQPVTPRAIAARARTGRVPGHQPADLVRRLDAGPGPALDALLAPARRAR